MRLLVCTMFSIDSPSAGKNRLLRMIRALRHQGHRASLVGQASNSTSEWEEFEIEGAHCVGFSPAHFRARRYCRAMQYGAQAALFYRKHLASLLSRFDAQGVISYAYQAQTARAILRGARQANAFVVADMVELFDLHFWYALNGMNYQQWSLCRSVLPKMDGLIGISKAWCDWAAARNLPHVWIPAFAEERGCVRQAPSPPDRPFTITFVGHWIERERPRALLKALRLCIDRGIDVRLNVLGNVGKSRRERHAMAMLRSDSLLQQHVNFLGFVSDQERDRQFAEADAFIILRSDNRETDMLFPTRLPEYLLTANPVILSRVGSFPYCFEHGKDIWFVSKENDPDEIAQAICYLAQHPEERRRIGGQGRQTALEQFSLDVLGKRLADFLMTLTPGSDLSRHVPGDAGTRCGETACGGSRSSR